MNSALKKLNKRAKKKGLKNPLAALNKPLYESSTAVQTELMELAKQTGLEALAEMKVPLNPILSWFDETQVITLRSKTPKTDKTTKRKTLAQPISVVQNTPASLARMPLKSPPCKKCPALGNGLCKCALKRFK